MCYSSSSFIIPGARALGGPRERAVVHSFGDLRARAARAEPPPEAVLLPPHVEAARVVGARHGEEQRLEPLLFSVTSAHDARRLDVWRQQYRFWRRLGTRGACAEIAETVNDGTLARPAKRARTGNDERGR